MEAADKIEEGMAGAARLLCGWAGQRGSALVHDAGGELQRLSGRSFDKTLHFDLAGGGASPYWNPVALCARPEYGASFAKRMAAVICAAPLPTPDDEYKQSAGSVDAGEIESGRRHSATLLLATLFAEGSLLLEDLTPSEILDVLNKLFIESAPPASLPSRHIQLMGVVGRRDGQLKVFFRNEAGQLVFRRAVRDVVHFLTALCPPQAEALWEKGGRAAILPNAETYRESIREATPVHRLIRVSLIMCGGNISQLDASGEAVLLGA